MWVGRCYWLGSISFGSQGKRGNNSCGYGSNLDAYRCYQWISVISLQSSLLDMFPINFKRWIGELSRSWLNYFSWGVL